MVVLYLRPMVTRTYPTPSAVTTATYAIPIFLSATLLFLIQPMMAKQLLPWFGGAAAVWTTCLVFFQSLLLLGYLYAHGLQRMHRSWQAFIHILLLVAGVILLYIPQARLHSPAGPTSPIWETARLLAVGAGLPYFLLSSTTPLLSAWYRNSTQAALPYRLFALSNLASLLGLLAYPLAVEPVASLGPQFLVWRGAFAAFAVLCGYAALRTACGRAARSREPDASPAVRLPDWNGRVAWFVLPACSSALLLSVTNGLSQNIAPAPLLWIVPLALYLVSFILCFQFSGAFRVGVYRILVPPALVGLVWTNAGAGIGVVTAAALCLASLFVLCMFCHALLAALKPAVHDLTSFYLCVSAGGALGGAFVGLAAPALFREVLELQIAISACLVLSLRYLYLYRSRGFLSACGVLAVAALWTVQVLSADGTVTYRGRNFYGALSIRESTTPAFGGGAVRTLLHGRVQHGGQLLSRAVRREPTFYYGRESGVGIALQRPLAPHRVGVIGLGAGTVATYGKHGDYYRFYEINPLAAELAQTEFSYLSDSRATTDVVLGDGRLTLEREAGQSFDTLVVDAFSGDAIPVHLLTLEAFRCYYRHLAAGGIIAVHVSSSYVDLRPVVADVAAASGRHALFIQSAGNPQREVARAAWILVSESKSFLEEVQHKSAGEFLQPSGQGVWTDRYSNLLGVLR